MFYFAKVCTSPRMMGMQLKSILIVFIVYLGLMSVQPHSQMTDEFRNLFDSMAKNKVEKRETYRGILNQYVAKNKQAFDAMKEELQTAGRRKFYQSRKFYQKRDVNAEDATKKEATEDTDIYNTQNRTYTFPEIRTQDAFHPTLKLLLSQKEHYNRLNKIYDKMRNILNGTVKNIQKTNEEFIDDLNGTLYWLGNVIDKDIDLVNKLIHGDIKADENDEKAPWSGASSDIAHFHWRMIRKYGSQLMGDKDLIKERAHLVRIADLARSEVDEYKLYLNKTNALPVFTAAPKMNVTVINVTVDAQGVTRSETFIRY